MVFELSLGSLVGYFDILAVSVGDCHPQVEPTARCPDLCDSGIMALVVAHTARIFILYICSPWHNVPLYIACMLLEWRLLKKRKDTDVATTQTKKARISDGWIVSRVVGVSHWEKIYEYEFVVLTARGALSRRPSRHRKTPNTLRHLTPSEKIIPVFRLIYCYYFP